jgi:uncharacterized protein with HEPN domain/predicted nucleotidyltransferase
MNLDTAIDALRRHDAALKSLGVKSLAIFGSVARNEATTDSDLDVLVDFEAPATFDAYMAVKTFIEDTLDCRVDLVMRKAVTPRMRAISNETSCVSRDERLYLDDMVECCRKVLRYTKGMAKSELVADEKTFDAVMRNLEITGEAARQVSKDIRDGHPEVAWRSISGFRDIAIHAYPTIDEDVVWDIVENKVPELLDQITAILAVEFPD